MLSDPRSRRELILLRAAIADGATAVSLTEPGGDALLGREALRLTDEVLLRNVAQNVQWLGASTPPERRLRQRTAELSFALHEVEERNYQLTEDLLLASDVPRSLLPRQLAKDHLNVAYLYVPCTYLGGDFYDPVAVDDRRIGADVSGHGSAAALITAMFKFLFSQAATGKDDPVAVLTRLNEQITQLIQTEHFLTAFYAVIDTVTLECRFCSAGHPP